MRNPKTILLSIIFAVLMVVAGSLAINASAQWLPHTTTTFNTASDQTADQTVTFTDEGQLFAQLYDQVSPSVVSINVIANREPTSTSAGGTVYGTGSGFVVDTLGHIVTNNHVVAG